MSPRSEYDGRHTCCSQRSTPHARRTAAAGANGVSRDVARSPRDARRTTVSGQGIGSGSSRSTRRCGQATRELPGGARASAALGSSTRWQGTIQRLSVLRPAPRPRPSMQRDRSASSSTPALASPREPARRRQRPDRDGRCGRANWPTWCRSLNSRRRRGCPNPEPPTAASRSLAGRRRALRPRSRRRRSRSLGHRRLCSTALTRRSNTASGCPTPFTTESRFWSP